MSKILFETKKGKRKAIMTPDEISGLEWAEEYGPLLMIMETNSKFRWIFDIVKGIIPILLFGFTVEFSKKFKHTYIVHQPKTGITMWWKYSKTLKVDRMIMHGILIPTMAAILVKDGYHEVEEPRKKK